MPDIPRSGLHQATAFISSSALRFNAQLAADIAGGDSQHSLLCMVKANAYGHGLVECARMLEDLCWGFGVARMSEGMLLRDAGISKPIVVMSDYSIQYDIKTIQKYHLTPTLYCEQQASDIAHIYQKNEQSYWLKINTGMHRLGLNIIQSSDLVSRADVIATHLHSAGEIEREPTDQQLEKFIQSLDFFDDSKKSKHLSLAVGGAEARHHLTLSFANSAALLYQKSNKSYNDWKIQQLKHFANHKEIVRPGIMLYGADPLAQANEISRKLKPVMTLAAPIVDIRTLQLGETVGYNEKWRAGKISIIATVAIGYGDGYPRHAINETPILIHGGIAKLVGNVSMDMIGVDITDLVSDGLSINIGDSAILWGQDLPIEKIAEFSSSISYELMTSVSARVARVYTNSNPYKLDT